MHERSKGISLQTTRNDIPTLLLDNVKISNRMEVSAINAEGIIR